MDRMRAPVPRDPAGSFVLEFVQTYVLQRTGQRIMFDLRAQIYGHPPATRRVVLRSQSRRPDDDAG